MFLVKIAVGICCVYACVRISSWKANKLKEDLLYYDSVVMSCDKILSGLSYSKSTICELLNVDYSSVEYAKTVRSYIKNENLYYPSFLSSEEVFTLNTYFSLLGKSDTKTQKNAILSHKNTFQKIQEDKKKQYDKNYYAIIKVGFSLGIMLFILVI